MNGYGPGRSTTAVLLRTVLKWPHGWACPSSKRTSESMVPLGVPFARDPPRRLRWRQIRSVCGCQTEKVCVVAMMSFHKSEAGRSLSRSLRGHGRRQSGHCKPLLLLIQCRHTHTHRQKPHCSPPRFVCCGDGGGGGGACHHQLVQRTSTHAVIARGQDTIHDRWPWSSLAKPRDQASMYVFASPPLPQKCSNKAAKTCQ